MLTVQPVCVPGVPGEEAVRRIHRADNTQADIVDGLRRVGVRVFVIGRPVDLLTLHRGKWLPIECKSQKRLRADQAEQNELVAECGIPRVTSLDEALRAVGAI